MGLEVLLYVPNVIGYIRVVLILVAWGGFNNSVVFVTFYVTSVLLDGLDGMVARRLHQTSDFGAWLDVVVDNFGRSMVWSMLFEWGWLVSSMEWCVFVCNHSALGAQWKSCYSESPRWVQAVMANGFKTPLEVLVISGLHVLPIWLYGYQRGVLSQPFCVPAWLQVLGLLLLSSGRLLCLAAEMWCMWTHVRFLCRGDEPMSRTK